VGGKAAVRTDRQTDATTDLDVSHTKCANLETDAQQQRPDKNSDFNHQGALMSRP